MRPLLDRLHIAPLEFLVCLLPLLYLPPAFAIDFSRLWPTSGVGAPVKELRNVGSFQSLKLSTAARVVIRQGERHSVEVDAESNVTPLIDTYVEEGVLVVEDAKHFKSSKAEVVITVRRITGISTTGSVAAVAEGLKAPELSLSMGGSSALRLKSVSLGMLRAALGGSSALKITGVAENCSFEMGGSSALQAAELAAKEVSVSGGGSAQAVVWATDSLRISLSGSAGTRHYGTTTPTLATSGAATVKYLGAAPPKE